MPEDLRLSSQDIKEIAANINQDLLAACQVVLERLRQNRPIDDSVKFQLQDAVLKPHAIGELVWINDIYDRFVVASEKMERINNQAVYDLLRGIAVAICLTMTEDEARELIEQINAQEIVSQYGHRIEYGKVIRRRSEAYSGDKPPESRQDSDNHPPESLSQDAS